AVTVLAPATAPTVSVVWAWPIASVVTLVAESIPPPLVTSNTTLTPRRGWWFPSLTIATNGSASVVPSSALWSLADTISSVGSGALTSTGALHAPSTIPNTPSANTQRIHAANMANPR